MDSSGHLNSPGEHGFLPVSDGHRLFWEESGLPQGVPALHLHGGPGGTLGNSGYRHRWDLARTRLIGFEQRGCGRSTPSAADLNIPADQFTTQKLIEDIEALRIDRGIDKWILNGVSWGSTLALAYAQARPSRVIGLVLFAVTTTSREEVQWITETVGAIFPEAWDRLSKFARTHIPGYESGEMSLVEAYAQMLSSPVSDLRDAASIEWALWEDTHISLGSERVLRDPRWKEKQFRHAMTRLTTHFWSHSGFCQPPILDQVELINHLPAIFIHGRNDVSSPAATAWKLHRSWPGSELQICEGDAHGRTSMVERWTAANLKMLDLAS
ncbi:alpha/beta fold hydrolase [Glutamicibacter halophytocola]|uniref:alpha/beta fold hydrolase n=1 Tax=Glutamicibacter halophytocola TaxID=1933880 RepID=UPI0015C53DDE|nr:alpha/beta fold hydrolase [Glutamicibacter halophytocola]NQD40721.1 alpha/beta fold hydrolase [Glutamicibacter halophytocola]